MGELEHIQFEFPEGCTQVVGHAAVRHGSLELRGKVGTGNRYMSLSFCPLGL